MKNLDPSSKKYTDKQHNALADFYASTKAPPQEPSTPIPIGKVPGSP